MTTLEMRADPDLLVAFGPLTVNSICRPSSFVTSASPLTRRPTGVAARWRGGTDRALAGIEISPDRVESSVFHDQPLAPRGTCLMACSQKAEATNPEPDLLLQAGIAINH